MALYVYKIADGALVSWCPGDADPVAPPEVLSANGLAMVAGLPPLDATHVWNAASKTIDTVTAPVLPNNVTTAAWIMQFTPQEYAAIKASTDPAVAQFLFAVTSAMTLNLNNPIVVNGLQYLVSLNLLTPVRAETLQTVSGL